MKIIEAKTQNQFDNPPNEGRLNEYRRFKDHHRNKVMREHYIAWPNIPMDDWTSTALLMQEAQPFGNSNGNSIPLVPFKNTLCIFCQNSINWLRQLVAIEDVKTS